jgi:septal ring factor EnvC (AmiA/AmiB activator)
METTEMYKEIQEAINKNIPQHVGEVLKKRLEQADKDAAKVKELNDLLTSRNADIAGLNKTIEEYKKFDERNSKLVERENAVAEKERNQKVFEAEERAKAAEARANEMAGFVGMVFKSPVFRRTVTGSSGGYYDSQGRYCNSFDNNKTETKTEE